MESEAKGSWQPPAKRVVPKGMGIMRSALRQCGDGIDGCASVFQTEEARSMLATRSNLPRSSSGRIPAFQADKAGS